MLSEPDGMTTLAKLLFLVPAVFAMLAAPFWIWAQLRAPAPEDDGDGTGDDDGDADADADASGPVEDEYAFTDEDVSEPSDSGSRDSAPPDDDQRSC